MNRTVFITLAVVVIVGGLAFFQKPTGGKLVDLASNKAKEQNKLLANTLSHDEGHKAAELPKPQGSKNAPIQVRVYVTSDNACDTTTITAMQKLHDRYPGKVYIEFADLLKPDVKKEADKVKIGCKSGVTINGKTRFFLPGRGLKGTIMLDGPVGQKNYTTEDIDAVVKFLLEHPEKAKTITEKYTATGSH